MTSRNRGFERSGFERSESSPGDVQLADIRTRIGASVSRHTRTRDVGTYVPVGLPAGQARTPVLTRGPTRAHQDAVLERQTVAGP